MIDLSVFTFSPLMIVPALFVSATFGYLSSVGAQFLGRNTVLWHWYGFFFWLLPLMILPLLPSRKPVDPLFATLRQS